MLGDIKDRSRARLPALIGMGSATVLGRHVPRLAEHFRFCIRVYPCPSVVKKHDFAKRTHFKKFHKSMQINKKHKNSASFWPKKPTHFLLVVQHLCPSVAKVPFGPSRQISPITA